jgi:hypothetical protein
MDERFERSSPWAFGAVMFAGIMMITVGVFQSISGLAAVFEDTFYVLTRNYVFEFDVTTWGWIHLIGGILVAIAGFYLLAGRRWAALIAMIFASINAVQNFMFIPYYPVWSLLIIAIDIVVIWALTVYRRETAL